MKVNVIKNHITTFFFIILNTQMLDKLFSNVTLYFKNQIMLYHAN